MASLNGVKVNNARLYDPTFGAGSGIGPNGLPVKFGNKCTYVEDYKKLFRLIDEQNAIRRYKWYNLPKTIDSQLLERMLYYRGQVAIFMLGEDFYILPYALDGDIDVYGRFNDITPVPFNGKTETDGKQKAWIQGLRRKVIKDVTLTTDEALEAFENGCVLLWDYSPQMSQTIIPRSILQETILQNMAEVYPLIRTNCINNINISGLRVPDGDCANNVNAMSNSIENAAMTGKKYVPLESPIEVQELANGNTFSNQELLMYLQALNNFRLSTYGLGNGSYMEKQAHLLQDEVNSSNAELVYQDGLECRQRFCDIVNSIWGIGIWCEPSEVVLGQDTDGDGVISDEQDQSGTHQGEQPQEVASDD